jgi:hypothetical protein
MKSQQKSIYLDESQFNGAGRFSNQLWFDASDHSERGFIHIPENHTHSIAGPDFETPLVSQPIHGENRR